MIRPEDGFKYYAYVLIYVDGVMVVHHDAESVLISIGKYFNLNPSSIVVPDIYLGFKLNKIRLDNVVWASANIPARYVKESVANIENYLAGLGNTRWKLPNNTN